MRNVKVPDGMSEQEVTETILRVANRLAPKYTFNGYDADDIVQEAFIIAVEALPKYDSSKPLENYLSVCLSNRLKNFVRDNHLRYLSADASDEEREAWENKYAAKKNLLEPLPIDKVKDEREKNMWTKIDFLNDIQSADIFRLIDLHLPVHLRTDFLRMKQGILIPKPRREKIEAVIITILEEHGYETW